MKRLARQDGAKPSLMGGIERNFASSSPSSFAETLDFRTNWPRVGACSQCRIQTLRWGGEGGGRGEREKVGGRSPKEVFLALRASVWSKNKGGAPGPFRWIRHWFVFSLRHTLHVWQFLEPYH